MRLKGRVWKFGDNINTDEIIPARYLNIQDPRELAQHCMEDVDKDFVKKVAPGDIIVGGKNFGCGSSREQAPLAIKEAGISVVIARSFARIFYRNAVNIGLPIMESQEASQDIRAGEEIELDLKTGKIRSLARGKEYLSQKYPEFMQELIQAGGLMEWVKKRTKK